MLNNFYVFNNKILLKQKINIVTTKNISLYITQNLVFYKTHLILLSNHFSTLNTIKKEKCFFTFKHEESHKTWMKYLKYRVAKEPRILEF